jgi:hypothetical protein
MRFAVAGGGMQAFSTLGNLQSRRDGSAHRSRLTWSNIRSGGVEASPCRSLPVPSEDEGRPTKTIAGQLEADPRQMLQLRGSGWKRADEMLA